MMPDKGKYVVLVLLLMSRLCDSRAQSLPLPAGVNTAPPTPSGKVNTPVPDLSSLPAGSPFRIRKIYITGNRRTKENIIRRELPFKENEEFQLQNLVARFETASRQLMNTTLFHEANVTLKSFDGYNVDILVDVKERWYIFPLPYFKPVDRNINQWIVEQKGNLSRVDYGLKLLHNNTTGRNDKLNVWLVNGYTKRVSLGYDRLYIDRNLKWGMRVGLNLGQNREVNYQTAYNKQVFYKDPDRYVRSFFNANAELTYRRAIKSRHRFGIAYTSEKVIDTITRLNPSYLLNGRKSVRYPELYYVMQYNDVDYIPYPLRGYTAEVMLNKKGFNQRINLWQASVKGGGYWPVARKTYLGVNVAGSLKLPFKQPFYNQRLFGYGDFFMQGYEYYVLDGVAGGLLKASLSKQVAGFNARMPLKKSTIREIPFRIYAKIYGNTGYIYNPSPGNNFLNNKMLYSWGVGVDVITIYDFVLRLEWSFNQIGENGLYLHKSSF